MTLQEKLEELKVNHPEIYEVLCTTVPDLVARPSSPTAKDLDHYNFWIDAILDEDEAQHLYHLVWLTD